MSRQAQAAGHRHARLQHVLYDELDAIFRCELSDPNLEAVHLTAVELSVDCRNARVWYVHPSEEDAARGLERALPFIRHRLAESLSIKRAPELRFEFDRYAVESSEEGSEEVG